MIAALAFSILSGLPSAQNQAPIEWVTRAIVAPKVSFHKFQSKAANTEVSYHLYTPSDYQQKPTKRFPVVYWLHGSGGGLSGIGQVARHFDQAIQAGKVPPVLVVFVNGTPNGMYVDWKDGSAPMEQVIVKDLLTHVDQEYRTITDRKGRLLDGFSMGGYGSARLGFKYPELFGAMSIVGAGPMQANLLDAPRAGRARAQEVLNRVYGGDPDYFLAVSPLKLADRNAEKVAKSSLVRIVIGADDNTLPANLAFHKHLESLKVPHTYKELPGIGHDPMAVLRAMGDSNWDFYRSAFGEIEKAESRS